MTGGREGEREGEGDVRGRGEGREESRERYALTISVCQDDSLHFCKVSQVRSKAVVVVGWVAGWLVLFYVWERREKGMGVRVRES